MSCMKSSILRMISSRSLVREWQTWPQMSTGEASGAASLLTARSKASMSALVALSNAFGFASRLLAPLGFTRLPFRLGWKEFAPSAAAPHLVALVALDALMPSFLPEEDAFGLLRLKVLADVVVFIMAGSVSVALARARQPPPKLTLYLSLGRWGPDPRSF